MAVGQILGGNDYGQSQAGTGVGAYVPGDENTHDNQRAIEHVQDLNQQYQKEKDAQEEKEKQRRVDATKHIQVEPKGILPIDQQAFIDGQQVVNNLYTQAYADGKDPDDPKNGDLFKRAQGAKNALYLLNDVSSQRSKQLAESTKEYQTKPNLYHPNSSKQIDDYAQTPSSEYLNPREVKKEDIYTTGKDEKGQTTYFKNDKPITGTTYGFETRRQQALKEGRPQVALGNPILIAADQFDLGKYANENIKPYTQSRDVKDGDYNKTFKGSGYPREVDKKTGTEIPGTSGLEVHAEQMWNSPKGKQYIQEQMLQNPTLAIVAAKEANDRNLREGTSIPAEQMFAEHLLKPYHTWAESSSKEDAGAAQRDKKELVGLRGSINQQKEKEIGEDTLDAMHQGILGKGKGYYNSNGNWVNTTISGYQDGNFINADGKSTPNVIIYDTKDPDNPQMIRVYSQRSVLANKKDKNALPYELVPEEKYYLQYGPAVNKAKGSKDVSVSMEAGLKMAKKNGEYENGKGINVQKYKENKYGTEEAPQEEVQLPTAKSPSMLNNVVDVARNAIATGKKIVGIKDVPQTTVKGAEKLSAEQFTEQWAKAKKGDKLVGPDGKTYTKK